MLGDSDRKEKHPLAGLAFPSQVSHDFAINFDPENGASKGAQVPTQAETLSKVLSQAP